MIYIEYKVGYFYFLKKDVVRIFYRRPKTLTNSHSVERRVCEDERSLDRGEFLDADVQYIDIEKRYELGLFVFKSLCLYI